MNTETNSTPAEAVQQDFTTCPHWGKGGRYVVDPTDGRRVRVEELPAEAEAAPTDPSDGVVSKSTKPVKEAKRA